MGRGVRRHRSLESAGQKRHRYKETDRSTQVAESSISPPRTVISAPVSERNPHKRDRRSRKSEKFSQITSALPTSLNKVDLSPQRTDSLQKSQETPSTMVADVDKTEKDPRKVDSGPLKASPPEGDISQPRGQKINKAFHKVKGTSNKVDPNFQRDSEVAGCANKPFPSPVPTPESASSTAPVSAITTPVPIPRSHEWISPTNSENLPSSVFRHPAHTTTNPTRKRKHKPPPLKNKVHPNTDRPISGHPKPWYYKVLPVSTQVQAGVVRLRNSSNVKAQGLQLLMKKGGPGDSRFCNQALKKSESNTSCLKPNNTP